MTTPLQRLGELTDLISSGSTPKGGSKVYLENGPVLFIRSQNVRMNELDLTDVAYISEDVDTGMKRTRVRANDVLLNITGASIGRVAVFGMAHLRANVNQHVCIIRPKNGRLCSRYLCHYLATPAFQAEINRVQNGGTRQALTVTQIADFKIPLPVFENQCRIASILEKAANLLRKRAAALSLADRVAAAAFRQRFGDVDGNPKQLPIVPLIDLCRRITDGTHQPPKLIREGIPFLFVSNIRGGRIDFSTKNFITRETWQTLTARCPVEVNDILYTNVGSYGNAALVRTSSPFAFQRHIAHIKPDPSKVNPEFLSIMLESGGVRRQVDSLVRGIAQKTLNLSELRTVRVFDLPMPIQAEFSKLAGVTRRIRAQATQSLADAEQMLSALVDSAFRGKL